MTKSTVLVLQRPWARENRPLQPYSTRPETLFLAPDYGGVN